MTGSQPMGKLVQDETASFVQEMLIELVQLSRQSSMHRTASVIEAAALIAQTETDTPHSPASS